MSEHTKIAWTDHTFNPWIGCQKVGPGCDHCYAEALNARFRGANWGPGAPRRRTSSANWKQPLKWNRQAERDGVRRKVFCASMADVFDNAVPNEWRSDLFNLIKATPHLDWQLLTKRIGNVGNMLPVPFDFDRQYPNVWLGITIVNQVEANRDIPKLLNTPAAVRFLSIEPLLGPVDLTLDSLVCLPCPNATDGLSMDPETGQYECCARCDFTGIGDEWGIDLVIVGGESGPGARPMHPDWVRRLRDQCADACIPFFFKQWGEWQIASQENGFCGSLMPDSGNRFRWIGADGRTAISSSLGLTEAYAMARVGKKYAGNLLDGKIYQEFPS